METRSGFLLSPSPDRLEPTNGVKGKPERNVPIAFACQPEISLLSTPLLLFSQDLPGLGRDGLRVGPMLAPKIRMIRNRRVLGIKARRRGVEEMKSFRNDAGDDFCGHAAPRESFSDAKQSAGARD